MAGRSTALSNKELDFELRGVAWTPPATSYFALMTASPTDAGGGTEAAYTGYARQPITRATGSWTAAAASKLSNVAQVTFPVVATSPLVVTAVARYDALTAGELQDYIVLTSPITFPVGVAPSIAANWYEITDD